MLYKVIVGMVWLYWIFRLGWLAMLGALLKTSRLSGPPARVGDDRCVPRDPEQTRKCVGAELKGVRSLNPSTRPDRFTTTLRRAAMPDRDLRHECFSDALPPERPRRRYRKILTARPGLPVRALVTSEYVTVTRTHFQDATTYACIGRENGCIFCRKHINPRIKGYLAGIDPIDGKECLIELTEGAMFSSEVIRLRKSPLRGHYIILTREGKAPNSPVSIRWEADPRRSLFSGLKQPFDVREAVLMMWDIPQEIIEVNTGESIKPDNSGFFPEELNSTDSQGED